MRNLGGYQLQTDKLRQETGASHITCDVLFHSISQQQRLAVLSAVINESRIPQSVAYTLLAPSNWSSHLHVIDTLLRKGHLMGETFRKHRYNVRQNRLFRLRLPILSKRTAKLYSCSRWRLTEFECYEFWADNSLYGTVLEIKAPERKQAPLRRGLGSYYALRRTGIRKETFHSWLAQEATIPIQNWPHIAYAWLWGLLICVRLCIQAHRLLKLKTTSKC